MLDGGNGDVFLETERLVLRRLTEVDALLLHELDSDPEVMRYLSGGSPTPLALIRDEILPRFIGYYDRARWAGVWAAIEKSSGDFLGWFSLRPDDDPARGGDLGYRLRRPAWGRGLATEAARALLDRAFRDLNLPRAYATTYEHNLASRRVLEKLGMRLVRRFRLEEERGGPATFAADASEVWDGDEVEYAIEREEWLAPSSGGLAGPPP